MNGVSSDSHGGSRVLAALVVGFAFLISHAVADEAGHRVGVTAVDITPSHPVRLNGFGFRRDESEGVTQKIWAKALAIGAKPDDACVLIAVDVLGIPDEYRRDVAQRLARRVGFKPERLTVTATHTHTAPMLAGANPTIFGVAIPSDHQKHIDEYTKFFVDRLEEAALKALGDLKPASLTFGIGRVTFAANRRTRGGPVDHDLPVLVVRDGDKKIRAIYTSYACHCVTLSNNKISGDWAGFAAAHLEKAYPGAVALVSVGCGADANPTSGVAGDRVETASNQGLEITKEIDRLLGESLKPINATPTIKHESIELALDKLPTRDDWLERAKRKDAVGFHAQTQLARLDRGEKLLAKIDYPIATWAFGDELAMVFLPGEVVVDFSLRLKKDFDRRRLWINAYANDDPCYIPSERILKEGGYEGGDAMIYYDVPTRFAAGVEQPIIDAVSRQLGDAFKVR
jgi:hypothetical protein